MDNFEFKLVGQQVGGERQPFLGYVSSVDKTNVLPQVVVRGSKNVYKKKSGNMSVRDGLKTYGPVDSTVAGITSSFEWYNSLARTIPVWCVGETSTGNDGELQFMYNGAWYTLLSGLSNTRFVFDAWWDNTAKKDLLLMVNGEDNIKSWSGGVSLVASGTGNTIVKQDTTTTWAQDGFETPANTALGDATTQFDITNPSGTTFRYTFDGTGTDPAITAATVPVGSYILIQTQNFTAANNGIFLVTNVGSNFFEVTNASGVAENNKTIGTGFIYAKHRGVLIVGSTTYAYTGGLNTTTLTGVVPSAAALVAGSVAFQAVMTWDNEPADGFDADFINVINNQLWVGSYDSRVVYVSAEDDFLDFAVPTPPLAGDPDFLILDDLVNCIADNNGDVLISCGYNLWYSVTYSTISDGADLVRKTNVAKQQVDYQAAAYAHEFVDNQGGNLVYLSKGQQLITFGLFKDLTEGKYPFLSQEVYTELQEENFTGGALRTIGDTVHITAPTSGRDWMFETRVSLNAAGQVTAERLWHPPQIRNVSRFAFIEGVLYGYSNANPMAYQINDTNQWHDDGPSEEPIPYTCVLRLAYRQTVRQGMTEFDKVYYEGYIANGVTLNGRVYMDYQGSSGLQDFIVNSVEYPAQYFSSTNPDSLGDSSLGDNPLGDGIIEETNDQELLPKFRMIKDINPVNVFEYELELYSTEADSRWEILSLGANEKLSTQSPTFLRR